MVHGDRAVFDQSVGGIARECRERRVDQQGVPARRVHGDGFRWMSGPGWRWGGRRGRLVERGGVSGYRNVISRFVERIVGQFVDHVLRSEEHTSELQPLMG